MNAPPVLRIAGYAALFDRADGARDTVRRGAFRKTLAERRAPLPLYWQHCPHQRIGWVETVGEDARGLRIIATVENPDGRAARMLKARAVSGLSFGYRARAYRQTWGLWRDRRPETYGLISRHAGCISAVNGRLRA